MSAPRPKAFSLLECTISVALIGLLLVTSMRTLAAAKRRETDTIQRVSGQQLVYDLMNEIILQDYKEPVSVATFGPESDEITGNRGLFDDVDDYNSYSSSPPTDSNGMVITGLTGWTQAVTVQWADPVTYAVSASSNTGLKKITVTSSYQGSTVTTLVAYRSVAWSDGLPEPVDTSGNRVPVAVATSPDLTKSVGQLMSFVGTSSSDADSDYLSYVWNYGDGTSGTGSTSTHAYTTAGTYTCTLTVYDGRGGVATASLTPVISP